MATQTLPTQHSVRHILHKHWTQYLEGPASRLIFDAALAALLLATWLFYFFGLETLPVVTALGMAAIVSSICAYLEAETKINAFLENRLLTKALGSLAFTGVLSLAVVLPTNIAIRSITGVPVSATPEATTAGYVFAGMLALLCLPAIVALAGYLRDAVAVVFHLLKSLGAKILVEVGGKDERILDECMLNLGGAMLRLGRALLVTISCAGIGSWSVAEVTNATFPMVPAAIVWLSYLPGSSCEGLDRERVAFVSDTKVSVAQRHSEGSGLSRSPSAGPRALNAPEHLQHRDRLIGGLVFAGLRTCNFPRDALCRKVSGYLRSHQPTQQIRQLRPDQLFYPSSRRHAQNRGRTSIPAGLPTKTRKSNQINELALLARGWTYLPGTSKSLIRMGRT